VVHFIKVTVEEHALKTRCTLTPLKPTGHQSMSNGPYRATHVSPRYKTRVRKCMFLHPQNHIHVPYVISQNTTTLRLDNVFIQASISGPRPAKTRGLVNKCACHAACTQLTHTSLLVSVIQQLLELHSRGGIVWVEMVRVGNGEINIQTMQIDKGGH
jgi:hypothetical protein